MFLTFCMTSIFDKWEDININFVSWLVKHKIVLHELVMKTPLMPPLSISSTILEKAFRKNAVQLF